MTRNFNPTRWKRNSGQETLIPLGGKKVRDTKKFSYTVEMLESVRKEGVIGEDSCVLNK